MYIQWKISHWTESINNQRSNRDIWHKSSIHDVNMNPVASCHLHSFYLVIVKQYGRMSTKYLLIDINKVAYCFYATASSIALFILWKIGKKFLMSWWNRNTLCKAKFADRLMKMEVPIYSFNSRLTCMWLCRMYCSQVVVSSQIVVGMITHLKELEFGGFRYLNGPVHQAWKSLQIEWRGTQWCHSLRTCQPELMPSLGMLSWKPQNKT